MTLPYQNPTISYTGNSVTTSWNYPFEIPFQSDTGQPAVVVFTTIGGVKTVIPSSLYSISGVGNESGGTVTYPLAGSPIPNTTTITIQRAMDLTQPNAFPNMGFLPERTEAALDWIVLMIQQLGLFQQIITALPTIPGLAILQPSGGDDGPILAALASPAILVGGNFLIETTQTTSPYGIILAPGAGFNLTTGKTLTFGGTFSTNGIRGGVFNNALPGEGTVVLNPELNPLGYPEWWGALTNTPTLDNEPPIAACLAACNETELSVGGYFIQNPIIIATNGKTLRGKGPTQNCCIGTVGGPGNGQIDPAATQLVVTSPSNHGVVVGTVQSTAAPNTTNVTLKGFTVVRATAAANFGVTGALAIANPPTVNQYSLFASPPPPCGIVVCWAALCHFEEVYTVEHTVGCYIYGCVEDFWLHVRHLRYTAGQHSANDFWDGFLQDNSAPSGYNSGNASIYYNECQGFSNFTISGAPGYTGNAFIQSVQGFTDTYVNDCESGITGYGVNFEGRQYITPDLQTEDLWIVNNKFDAARFAGIEVQIAGPETAVTITDNYVGVTSASSPVSLGIYLLNCHGSVVVKDNEVIGGAGNPATGLYYNTCSGITSKDNTLTDMSTGVSISVCFNVTCEDIMNWSVQSPAVAGVIISQLTVGDLRPKIYTSNATYTIPNGITMDSASNGVEVNVSRIDKTYITGHKLVANSVPITAAGTFGTNNLAGGIF